MVYSSATGNSIGCAIIDRRFFKRSRGGSGDIDKHHSLWQLIGRKETTINRSEFGSKVAGGGNCSKAVSGTRNKATIKQ